MPKRRSPLLPSLLLLLLCSLAGPRAGQAAQQMVAVVLPGDLPAYRAAHEAFMQILQAGGMADQVKIVVQTPNPDKMSLANSVRRLVGAGAGILVTYGAPATLIAKQEATKIPVLFASVYDPVSLDIVKSLEAPGADRTGASSQTSLATLVDALAKVRPLKSLGAIYNPEEQGSALQVKELEELGRRHGFAVLKQAASRPEEALSAVERLAGKVDALYLAESTAVQANAATILSQASAKGIPAISQIPGLAEQGALMTLEAEPEEQGKLLAVHTLQVLGGQKAHILPVRAPKKVALVINLKEAKSLGLTIPSSTLAAAGRIVK